MLKSLSCTIFLLACNSKHQEVTKEKEYINPVLNINFADPAVLKAPDGYYYVYGTNSEIEGNVVNIQVARSPDLMVWEHVGDALPDQTLWADKHFWAPHVFFDEETKTYFMYFSGESNEVANSKCLGVATSNSPVGPFIDKGEPLICGKSFEHIDPMAFDDPESGKRLLYWGSAHLPLYVQELSDDRLGFRKGSSPLKVLDINPDKNDPNNYEKLIEGPWITKEGEFYYLFYSGDNCCGNSAHYAVGVSRSKNAMGPFTKMGEERGDGVNTILTENQKWLAPGHNSIIKDEDGQYWILYHAIEREKPNEGRKMLIDRVEFKDGWPVILN